MTDSLFSSEELRGWLEEQQQRAVAEVRNADKDTLRFNPDRVTEWLVDQFDVQEISIDWSRMTHDEVREVQLSASQFGERYAVNGFATTLHVPFTGSARLFKMRASTLTLSGNPEGTVSGQTLVLEVTQGSGDIDAFQSSINQLQTNVDRYVEWCNIDVRRWHQSLRDSVAAAVQTRKTNLDTAASLSEALTVPLRATVGATVIVPVARKTVRATEVTTASRSGDAPNDPAISEAIYEDVLKTLRSVGSSFERLPKTAARFKEEELRDLLLFILNSNYEGAASGEVFNGAGKTDLLIRHKDRNAFIGECKIWHGAKAFGEAIDQLLSYTVWRDTKAALILFIRGGNATEIIDKADTEIKAHPGFDSDRTSSEPEARRDYLMRATDDRSRTVRVALLPIVVRALPEDSVAPAQEP